MNKNYVLNSNKNLLHVYICCARPNGRTVRHIMSRSRFQAILLHCSDNVAAPEPGEAGYDPLHKTSPIIYLLNETFSKNYRYKIHTYIWLSTF